MNSRSKGNRLELAVKKDLEKKGWLVYRSPPSRKFQNGQDMFNLWDLLAVKSAEFKFIQVKANRKRYYIKYQNFAREHHNPFVTFEYWVKKDRGDWEVTVL